MVGWVAALRVLVAVMTENRGHLQRDAVCSGDDFASLCCRVLFRDTERVK